MRDGDACTGLAQAFVSTTLNIGEASAVGLQLQSEALTTMDDDEIRNAGNDAKRLEDLRFDGASPAAIRHVERERAWHGTPAEMVDYRALDLLLWAGAAGQGATRFR
jgi:hypothetical protein